MLTEEEAIEQLSNHVFEIVSEVITEDEIYSDEVNNEMNFDTPLTDEEDIASRINVSLTTTDSSENEKPKATITLSKTIDTEIEQATDENESDTFSDALDDLSDEVRRASQEIYNRRLLEMNRSVS